MWIRKVDASGAALCSVCNLVLQHENSSISEDENDLLLLRSQKDTQTVPGAGEHAVPPSETNRIACVKAVLCSFIALPFLKIELEMLPSQLPYRHPNNLENPDPRGVR